MRFLSEPILNTLRKILNGSYETKGEITQQTCPSDMPMGELRMKSGGAITSTRETASSFSSVHKVTMADLILRVGSRPET